MTYYRYLQGDKPINERALARDEAETDEGVIAEVAACPKFKISRRMGDFTRATPQTAAERRAEEASWAARSGPVTVRHKGAREVTT